jgi:hypothetical protein
MLEGTRGTKEITKSLIQDSQLRGVDSSPELLEYEAGVLTTGPQISVGYFDTGVN